MIPDSVKKVARKGEKINKWHNINTTKTNDFLFLSGFFSLKKDLKISFSKPYQIRLICQHVSLRTKQYAVGYIFSKVMLNDSIYCWKMAKFNMILKVLRKKIKIRFLRYRKCTSTVCKNIQYMVWMILVYW